MFKELGLKRLPLLSLLFEIRKKTPEEKITEIKNLLKKNNLFSSNEDPKKDGLLDLKGKIPLFGNGQKVRIIEEGDDSLCLYKANPKDYRGEMHAVRMHWETFVITSEGTVIKTMNYFPNSDSSITEPLSAKKAEEIIRNLHSIIEDTIKAKKRESCISAPK